MPRRSPCPSRVDAGDREHARDRRGRAHARRAAPAVAGGDHDDDVVLERVEERRVPALVPVRGVRGQREVDDVGAVVDRPADRLGDLIGEAAPCADAPKPTETASSSASGATPIMPAAGPVPRAAASEATQLPWLRVHGADRRAAVGGADTRDIRAADDGALELDRAAADARVDDRDAHARAARRRPGVTGCRTRRASTPPPAPGRSAWRVGHDRGAGQQHDGAAPTADAASSGRIIRPAPGSAQTQRSRRPRRQRERAVADRVDAGTRRERVRRQRVQALDARRHPAGRDAVDLVDLAESGAVAQVRLVGRADRPRARSPDRPRARR